MINFNKFILIFLPIILAACSSTKLVHNSSTEKEYEKIVASSNLQIKIPLGWKEIKDNNEQLFDIWLVNNKNYASIVFLPIYLSEKLTFSNTSNELETIANIVLAKKRSSKDSFEIISRRRIISPFEAITIKYELDGSMHNSIIFGKEKVFYESQAYFKENSRYNENDLDDLIILQKEIISEARLK